MPLAAGKARGEPRWRVVLARLVLAVLVVYLLSLLGYGEYRLRSLDRDLAEATRRLGDLYRRNRELREEMSRLRSPAYVEERARTELGLVRDGEIPFAPGRLDER